MRAAERSHKAAIENQQNIPAAQIRETDDFSSEISQLKIWSGGIYGDVGHGFPAYTGFLFTSNAAARLAATRPKVTQVATVTRPACGNLTVIPASAHKITRA